MELANKEYIELKDKEKSIYIFRGLNNEIFDLVFDTNEKYFKIIHFTNDLLYTIKCENSYRNPDLKKLLITYKYIDICDSINIFHYDDLKIANINTTFETTFEYYYDEKLKKDIYTKKPKYYTYLIKYNNYCTILSYNENKYSTKSINIC